MIRVVSYVDGSCNWKNRIGGIGVHSTYIFDDNTQHEDTYSAGYEETTIGRMEISAVIHALDTVPEEWRGQVNITIYSDSQYVVNSINKWIKQWAITDYIGYANSDLWRIYTTLQDSYLSRGGKIKIIWVRGHDNNIGNEKADALAKAGYYGIKNCPESIG